MTLSRLLIAAVSVVALALVGVWIGRMMQPAPQHSGAELHALMHAGLDLDPAQERALAVLERDFAAKREALEARLKADNSRLADAIAAEHQYGPRVSAAVDASHVAMGELQKATLEHVFAMREILRPDQQAKFDAAVAKSLAQPSK
ncbi:periplasmic heavy metal sensor [Erythrobacter sp. T5W1-R]|uniref:periplasmic heavy metal sensor n=1 Tax=Erythrobacter sp. T5W1-R TaxID=3101752 RepID=UPI002AFE0BF8|nr:periplasmic heavy metal sensor [Erythrobacter sp. T5W1-R]MEA1619164.1 periplasmic heavy metal sensor [Erythrobacter sp. T5W1-R]